VRDDASRKIFFTGTEDERAYVDTALQSGGEAQGPLMNCCGMLSLGELVALFERARFLVTNDSGPMHVAAAAGIPVVALFGPESPEYYSPRGRAKICYKAVECSPCLNIYNAKQFVCPHQTRCMEEISTGDVMVAIESLMSDIRVNLS
jgi:heptosyltransferase-2